MLQPIVPTSFKVLKNVDSGATGKCYWMEDNNSITDGVETGEYHIYSTTSSMRTTCPHVGHVVVIFVLINHSIDLPCILV